MAKTQGEIWPSGSENYKLVHTLGKGPNATVMHLSCIPTGQEAAVKIIPLSRCSSNLEEIRREIQMIRLCNNLHLISYKSSFVVDQSLWLIMEYLSGGSLLDIMKFSHLNGFTDKILISTVLRDVIRGMEYLHNTGRVHRALKAGNVLLHPSGIVKLGDFGVSALLNPGTSETSPLEPDWMKPPELSEKQSEYGAKADIWALGITALELATGPSFRDQPSPFAILDSICPPNSSQSVDANGEGFSQAFRGFVEACLKPDPGQRPSAGKLLEFAFFQNARRADYVHQILCESLPPLWERPQQGSCSGQQQLCSPRSLSSQSAPIAQVTDSSVVVAAVENKDLHSSSSQSSVNVASAGPSSSGSGVNSDKVQVGRFTKTVIKPTLPSPLEKPADSEEDSTPTSNSTPVSISNLDPLQILIELQRQVQAMTRELEYLRAQNISLKRDLAAKKGLTE